MHKRNFRLDNGDCTNDSDFSILSFDVKEGENGDLLVKLPPEDELDALIGSSKCGWLCCFRRLADGQGWSANLPLRLSDEILPLLLV